MNLNNAVIYDIETFPNCFTLSMECLNTDQCSTWEISEFRDDRAQLIEWFNWLRQTQTPMIGFNNINFDYPVIHFLYTQPNVTVQQIYQKAMSIIQGDDRFGHLIWADNRFAPQIDIFKINHFDNVAKSTSLKALQINMRSDSVVDIPVAVGTVLTQQQINESLIPYNVHDVKQTKRFVQFNKTAIDFRVSLIPQFGVDVLNWPDTKIGSRMMETKIGDELCYDRSTGRKQPRQTPRQQIPLNDVIFPYVKFDHPEFNRVLNYLKQQTLSKDELSGMLTTKGVFNELNANVAGIEFHFGTGGIHGSVSNQYFESKGNQIIRDIDVASLYPSIAIVNQLAPEHLGQRFTSVYAELPKERKKWQTEKGKKCVEANTLKLASNGVYGNSNNLYSVFYDPKFTITITINGQLMLCMLAERLAAVPSLKILMINTDGITYQIDKNYLNDAKKIEFDWEKITGLTLEDAYYTRLFVRDVNNYVAEYEE